MFNSITGKVTGSVNSTVYIQTGGIEWALEVPGRLITVLPGTGEDFCLYTYLHHREDQMKLYGFIDSDERSVFLDLMKVSGIGPKQALKILTAVDYKTLITYLESEDIASLSSLPGIGEKTAKRIVLSLKGKLVLTSAKSVERYRDIITALTDMGFDRRSAVQAVKVITMEVDFSGFTSDQTEREILKRSIVSLSRQ